MKKELKKILKWVASIIFTLSGMFWLYTYIQDEQKRDDEIEGRLLSSPAMLAATETYITEFSGYSEVKNLDALNKLTDYYIDLTTSIDTMAVVARFIHSSLESNRLRNKAILNLVHHMDSTITILSKELKEVGADARSARASADVALTQLQRLKTLEIKNGD